jgi:hypothetical protein
MRFKDNPLVTNVAASVGAVAASRTGRRCYFLADKVFPLVVENLIVALPLLTQLLFLDISANAQQACWVGHSMMHSWVASEHSRSSDTQL